MTRFEGCKKILVAAAAVLIASTYAMPVSAQAKAAPKAAAADAKAPAKAKHRLPANYSKVVDDAQRDKIYAVQDKFADRKAALKKQLDELEAQEDSEIEGVLTADQKTKLAAMKEDKAKKPTATKKPAEKKPATDKAEKTDKKPA